MDGHRGGCFAAGALRSSLRCCGWGFEVVGVLWGFLAGLGLTCGAVGPRVEAISSVRRVMAGFELDLLVLLVGSVRART